MILKQKNIKGVTDRKELKGVTYISGDNGSGKTGTVQALCLALFGYVPEGGKKINEFMKIASDDVMCAGIEMPGLNFTRQFKKSVDGKGKAKYAQKISLMDDSDNDYNSNTEKDAVIQGMFGDMPFLLDFAEFVSLTDSKKKALMSQMGKASELWDTEKIKAYFAFEVLGDSAELIEEITVDGFIHDMDKEIVFGQDSNNNIKTLIEWLKKKTTYWNGKIKELKYSLAAQPEKIADSVAYDLKTTQLRMALDKMQVQKGVLQEKERAFKAAADKRDALLERIKRKEEALEMDSRGIKWVNYEAMIAEEEGKLKDETEYLEAIKCIDAKIEKVDAEIAAEDNEIAEYIGKIDEFQAKIKASEELIGKLQANDGRCVLSTDIPCENDFKIVIKDLEIEIEDLQDDIAECDRIVKRRHKEQDPCRAERYGLTQAKEIRETERKDCIANNEKIREAIKRYERLYREQNEEQKERENRIEGDKKELALLREQLLNLPVVTLEKVYQRKEKFDGTIKLISDKITKRNLRIKQDLEAIRLKEELDDAGIKIGILNKAVDVFGTNGLQKRLLEEQLGGINEVINENLRAFGIEKNFFYSMESEGKKEVFKFGWQDTFSTVEYDVLSGAEKLYLVVAMQAAFIELNNPKFKLLVIDNMDRIHMNHREQFFKGLMKLNEKINLIVVAGATDTIDVEGVNNIVLRKKKELSVEEMLANF